MGERLVSSGLETKEGWGPGRVWHYYRAGKSLCGRALFFGKDLQVGNDGSPDNCARCRRLKLKVGGTV